MAKAVYVDQHVLPHDFSAEQSIYEENGVEFTETQVESLADFAEKCKDADVIITCHTPVGRDVIEALPNLKMVVRTGVGFEQVDMAAATEHGVAVCNIPHFCMQELALQTVGHILNAVRRIGYENRLVHEGQWGLTAKGYPFARLSAMTLGLIGFGNAARTVAGYMKSFGCRIMACDPYLADEVFANAGVCRGTFEEVLQHADIISVHVPYSEATHHLMNKDTFSLMKDGSYFINTSRGGVVDQDALCDALESGKIRAAGLDVLEEEPPTEKTARILQYDNVFITAHTGAQSPEAMADLFIQVAQTAVAGALGKIPDNTLNKKELAARK